MGQTSDSREIYGIEEREKVKRGEGKGKRRREKERGEKRKEGRGKKWRGIRKIKTKIYHILQVRYDY